MTIKCITVWAFCLLLANTKGQDYGNYVQSRIVGYTGSYGANRQVSTQDLVCNFQNRCCWKTSTLEEHPLRWFVIGSPPVLKVSASRSTPEEFKAVFESCKVSCNQRYIVATVSYEIPNDVELNICLNLVKSKTKHCKPLKASNRRQTVAFEKRREKRYLTIEAKNFVRSQSKAVIHHIDVACTGSIPDIEDLPAPFYVPVTLPTRITTKKSGSTVLKARECEKIECPFTIGMCHYISESSKSFKFADMSSNNKREDARDYDLPNNRNFAMVTLRKGESAVLRSDKQFTSDHYVKFLLSKSEGSRINIKGCCTHISNCRTLTTTDADSNGWTQKSFLCPQGTEKVHIFVQNNGRREVGVGIADIQLYDQTSNNRIC